MALTGTTFLGLVLAATVTAFVFVVWRWRAVAAPGARSVARRVARLAGLNLLVLLSAAVALNHTFLFYADWTDLFGAAGVGISAKTLAAGGAPSGALGTFGRPAGSTLYRLPGLPPGLGPEHRVLYFDVTGRTSGMTGEVIVVPPNGYRDKANGRAHYPVIEAFHGYPGEPAQILGTVLRSVDGAMAHGRLAPSLIVAPQLEWPVDGDTECANGPLPQLRVETFVTADVPYWVEHTFRVRTDRGAWATLGYSSGGWGAAMAAIRHPDQFGAALVFGGYFRPEFSRLTPFPVTPALTRAYDLVATVQAHPPPLLVWLETSHSDPVSYPSTEAFLAAARAPL